MFFLLDFIEQDNALNPHTNDTFLSSYIDWAKTLGVPLTNIFHVTGGVHDGWDDMYKKNVNYYDGYFRLLNETSTVWLRKIGNLAIIGIGDVRGYEGVRQPFPQLKWFSRIVQKLASEGYNIFVLKHTNLYNTTAYTDGSWKGTGTSYNVWVTNYIKKVTNQYADNVIMYIQAHVHLDATDVDSRGRKTFMNWTKVQGNSEYTQIKAYVVCVAGISTTMHNDQYKSYQNLWYMDLTEGESSFTLKALNITADPDQEVLSYTVPLKIPFEGLTDNVTYEHFWGPCKFEYDEPLDITYANSSMSEYQIYVKAGEFAWFESKFRFNTPVPVKDIIIDYEGDASSLTKEIAYSIDGSHSNYSSFSTSIPNGSYSYWKVRINITATTQVNIFDLKLIHTRSLPFGGIWIPVDKLALYIGLTILLAVAVTTVVYIKKRKRHVEINS